MTKEQISQWDDSYLSTNDAKFYARRTTVGLVYGTTHPRTTAIDVQRLLKAARVAKRRHALHMFTLYFAVAVFGSAIVAGCVLILWALCMLAWAGFGS